MLYDDMLDSEEFHNRLYYSTDAAQGKNQKYPYKYYNSHYKEQLSGYFGKISFPLNYFHKSVCYFFHLFFHFYCMIYKKDVMTNIHKYHVDMLNKKVFMDATVATSIICFI